MEFRGSVPAQVSARAARRAQVCLTWLKSSRVGLLRQGPWGGSEDAAPTPEAVLSSESPAIQMDHGASLRPVGQTGGGGREEQCPAQGFPNPANPAWLWLRSLTTVPCRQKRWLL